MKKILIVGGGFAGLNAAKGLKNVKNIEVTLIDRNNYHLFQPLLYQVAMAGLSPAEIAIPLRSLLARYKNFRTLQGEAGKIDFESRILHSDIGRFAYDYLVLACGARHIYFGNEGWEGVAPGLKTIEQATEIRRRVLSAFEKAEAEEDPQKMARYLTFIIVGGGPTGVELAGALGELTRYTLAKDFKRIDPTLSRIILLEAGPRLLPTFSRELSARATRDLEKLGVEVWTFKRVTHVSESGVELGEEKILAATVIWAAGVQASGIATSADLKTDALKRIFVAPDLSLAEYPEVFVAGDQAHVAGEDGKPLPGLAPVAQQQGRFIAEAIKRELKGKPRGEFHYKNRGQLATIGRSRAILEFGRFECGGFIAWLLWLVIHIYFLIGFQNRLFVLMRWASSYFTFKKGARLVINKNWRFYPDSDASEKM